MPTLKLLAEVAYSVECKQNCKIKITKDILIKFVEITLKEDPKLSLAALTCMSHFICYHPSDVAPHLEGSGVGGAFIQYFSTATCVDYPVILQAVCNLCSEGAIRRDVRTAGVLPKLLSLTKSQPHHSHLYISLFHHFVYDKASISILAREKDFISLLMRHVTLQEAAALLAVLPRIRPPPMDLVQERHLEILLDTPTCASVLRQIVTVREYLKPLLVSKVYWRLYKAGYRVDISDMPGYVEELLTHLLSISDSTTRENVAQSVPFLLSSRDFKLQYKLLAHHHVLTTLLRLLTECPTEERVLASVVQLIQILGYTFWETPGSASDKASGQMDDTTAAVKMETNAIVSAEETPTSPASGKRKGRWREVRKCQEKMEVEAEAQPEVAQLPQPVLPVEYSSRSFVVVREVKPVTFELDDGQCRTVNKCVLCANSPVLDAMLNGHFVESQQARVRLTACSAPALDHLVMMLSNDMVGYPTSVRVHLELISLTDRFLISWLHERLCSSVTINKETATEVYLWCHASVDTPTTTPIRHSVHDFLLKSSDHLHVAMQNPLARPLLIAELTDFLSQSVQDLL